MIHVGACYRRGARCTHDAGGRQGGDIGGGER